MIRPGLTTPIRSSFLLACLFAWFSMPAWSQVSVSGQAEVQVQPDYALFKLAVVNYGEQLVPTREKNQATIEHWLARAKALGMSPNDLATTPAMVFPSRWQCGSCSEAEQKTGYTARTEATFTLRRMSQLGTLANELSADGNIMLTDVEYHTSSLRQYRDQARAMAIRAAREKAQALAQELGQSIGPATSINESTDLGSGYWSWSQWGYSCCGYYRSYGQYGGGNFAQNVMSVAPSAGETADGAIAPGMIPVRASVSVVFELKR